MTLLMREREKYKEGMVAGKVEGIIETYQELGFSFSEIVTRISDKFSFSLQEAEDIVSKHLDN